MPIVIGGKDADPVCLPPPMLQGGAVMVEFNNEFNPDTRDNFWPAVIESTARLLPGGQKFKVKYKTGHVEHMVDRSCLRPRAADSNGGGVKKKEPQGPARGTRTPSSSTAGRNPATCDAALLLACTRSLLMELVAELRRRGGLHHPLLAAAQRRDVSRC